MFLYQLMEKVGTRMKKREEGRGEVKVFLTLVSTFFLKLVIMLATQFNNFVAISFRGVARIFQRGGHRGYSLLLSLLYQRAQSYYRGMKAHIN